LNETTRPYCNSPWREVYVRVDGKVFPCCISGRALADLETATAEEIWRDGLAEFREEMMEGMPQGCEGCFIKGLDLENVGAERKSVDGIDVRGSDVGGGDGEQSE